MSGFILFFQGDFFLSALLSRKVHLLSPPPEGAGAVWSAAAQQPWTQRLLGIEAPWAFFLFASGMVLKVDLAVLILQVGN